MRTVVPFYFQVLFNFVMFEKFEVLDLLVPAADALWSLICCHQVRELYCHNGDNDGDFCDYDDNGDDFGDGGGNNGGGDDFGGGDNDDDDLGDHDNGGGDDDFGDYDDGRDDDFGEW